MPAPVLLTVDTELAWRHHARGASWQENLRLSYEAAGVGVPYKLDVLARHGLKACFFVDPMPVLVYGIEPIRRMVEPILDAGQEVQLHLHPFWADLADGRADLRYELTGLDEDEQHRLLRLARDLLVEAGAPPPIAFRAGSYGADAATLRALARLGLRYDSSFNAAHRDVSRVPTDTILAPRRVEGMIELPVGQIATARGTLRPLQICAVTRGEFRLALAHAAERGHPLTTIVSHSFELATRDGARPSPVHVRRFEALCADLDVARDTHPTLWASDLSGLALDADAEPALSPRLHTLARQVEQVWVNTRHERPAETATAAAGASLLGLELLLLAQAVAR